MILTQRMRNITKKIASLGVPFASALATYALTQDQEKTLTTGLATCFAHHALNYAASMIHDFDYYRRVRDIGAEKLWKLPAEKIRRVETWDRAILGLTAAAGLGLVISTAELSKTHQPPPQKPDCCTQHTLEDLFQDSPRL